MRRLATLRLPGLVIQFSAPVALATALALSPAAHSQVAADPQRAPTLTNERYSEDWSQLADPARRTGRWTEPFKYIRLDEDGSAYLTTGIEVRLRHEGYENDNWGSAPDKHYVWYRLMPYGDLHVGRVRLFAQPIVSAISGNRGPKTPVDSTGADLLQGFGELDLQIADRASLRLSAGRKLVSLGAGRLVDTRYGPNVPLAFDGVDTTLATASMELRAIYLRPVENHWGNLDDRTSRQKVLWGLYATQWLNSARTGGFDIYYLGSRDRRAMFDQGAGPQSVHSFGGRFFGDTGGWRWNVEGVVQRGRFAGKSVEAWGLGGEVGRRFARAPLQPELAVMLDVISGDSDPDDRRLGTFNPLFPRGKYFAGQSPVGPRNLIHLQPSATVHPNRDVALSLTGVAYWRESVSDGIYSIPGALVRSGRGSDARFIGKQLELGGSWQATPDLNLSASVSAFAPGGFIRDTGPARTIRVVAVAANFRF
jgi:hypothetical protein